MAVGPKVVGWPHAAKRQRINTGSDKRIVAEEPTRGELKESTMSRIAKR